MTSPIKELHGVIHSTLKADATLAALVGGRIYDRVPKEPEFPYVSYGPSQVITDDADCIRSVDVFIQIDVWSRSVGSVQCYEVADAVRNALHEQDLSVTDNALVFIRVTAVRHVNDPDGPTEHGMINIETSMELN